MRCKQAENCEWKKVGWIDEGFPQHARDLFLGKCVLLFWVVDYFPIFCKVLYVHTIHPNTSTSSSQRKIKHPRFLLAAEFIILCMFFFCFVVENGAWFIFCRVFHQTFFWCSFSVDSVYLAEQQYFMYILYHFLWCFIICVRWWCDDNRKNIKYSIARHWIFLLWRFYNLFMLSWLTLCLALLYGFK